MQNPDTISRRESPTRGWPKSMVERNRWPGAQQSSITIGNKSKADATGCLRGNLSPPLSPRRFFSPPADNTTVFNKYKTIHETVSTPFHFIYIYIYPLAPSSNSSRLFGFLRFLNAFQIDQNEFLSRLEYTQVRIN